MVKEKKEARPEYIDVSMGALIARLNRLCDAVETLVQETRKTNVIEAAERELLKPTPMDLKY